MPYIIENKKRKAERKANRTFDQNHRLLYQKDDDLQKRADLKVSGEKAAAEKTARRKSRGVDREAKPTTTIDRVSAQRRLGGRTHMTTPKARDKEMSLRASILRDGSVFAHELTALEEVLG
jgi:hypothetical protein